MDEKTVEVESFGVRYAHRHGETVYLDIDFWGCGNHIQLDMLLDDAEKMARQILGARRLFKKRERLLKKAARLREQADTILEAE